ncbi:MAG: aminopeptidase P family N-terminal domain-containing protein [Actinomycetota bacterium]
MNYEGRVAGVQAKLEQLQAEALLITNLTNVRYLTGFSGSNGQLLITSGGARFMTDGRYRARAAELAKSADVSVYADRPTDVLGPALEVHEAPRFSRISDDMLATGMVVTNEPGLYLDRPGGVRIEDCVMITATGAEVLTGAPKDSLLEL